MESRVRPHQQREAQPRGLEVISLTREHEAIPVSIEELHEKVEIVSPDLRETIELLQLLQPECRAELGRLEVPRQHVEDVVVVIRDAVEVLTEDVAAALGTEQVRLGPPAPAAQH